MSLSIYFSFLKSSVYICVKLLEFNVFLGEQNIFCQESVQQRTRATTGNKLINVQSTLINLIVLSDHDERRVRETL